MDLARLLVAVPVLLVALPLLRIWAWCVADAIGAAGLDATTTGFWAVALLFFNIVAIPAYVLFGPGRERWDPQMLWWPWKR